MKRFSNGILLDKNADASEAADAIRIIMNLPLHERSIMKEKSFDMWQKSFNACNNSKEFAASLRMLNNKARRIIIVTEGYPYGGERSFLETELYELIKTFDVSIIAVTSKEQVEKNEKNVSKLIENISDKENNERYSHKFEVMHFEMCPSIKDYILAILCWISDKRIRTEKKAVLYSNKNRIRCIWESIKYYAKALYFLKWITNNGIIESCDSDTIAYTYWYLYTTLAFCFVKQSREFKLITRAHRFDLYDYTYKGGRQPFRNYIDAYLDRIAFISKEGREYYIKEQDCTDDNQKYTVNYLGSRMPNELKSPSEFRNSEHSTVENDRTFVLVSCSNIIAVKNITLIIDALEELSKDINDKIVKWVHIGDGKDGEQIRKYAETRLGNKDNIQYEFLGRLDNDGVHQFYSSNKIDCFINTSFSEGLPVSIMEVMSYGIPIIATDVGGNCEAMLK